MGLSDTILKGTHPRTIPARFGLIWFRGFRGEDLNVKVYDVRRTPSDGKRGELKIQEKTVISTEMVDILLVIWPVITVYGIQ